MKAVLMSVRPKWCELITSGKKLVEIRKTKPKLETPFKVYIYCTLPPQEELFTHGCIREYANELIRLQDGRIVYDYGMRLCCDIEGRPYTRDNFLCQKVIGEFECDQIDEIAYSPEMHGKYISDIDDIHYVSCVNFEQMFDYLADGYGYAWHISDLVIYDKPKELSCFYVWKKCNSCRDTGYESVACQYDEDCKVPVVILRPPQSWCYVEGLAPAGAG